jgi:hypothetical protein
MTIENIVAVYLLVLAVAVASEFRPVVRAWDIVVERLAAQLRAALAPVARWCVVYADYVRLYAQSPHTKGLPRLMGTARAEQERVRLLELESMESLAAGLPSKEEAVVIVPPAILADIRLPGTRDNEAYEAYDAWFAENRKNLMLDAFKTRVEWATSTAFSEITVITADLEDLAKVVTFAVKDSQGDQTLIDFGAQCGDTRFAIVKPVS